ncbi:MAG: single-stranded-DNA-specific exonuclease RecJ [Desulfatibacillaceae bacterium]
MKKRWNIHEPDPDLVARLVRTLDVHEAVAAALVNRGITGLEQAEAFLYPTLSGLRRPESLRDADKAANRLAAAIKKQEPILVFGDYDADGVTATALVTEFLRQAGAEVSWHVPHRTKEGYGLKENHVRDVALPRKIRLIVTVDCGVSDHQAVRAASDAGIDVVVTDHHEPPESLPPALAVVNPKRPDCDSGLAHLAGVGVAFFLCIRLRAVLRETGHWETRAEPNMKRLCDLVALGTIADIVPVLEDNRVLIKTGLEVMAANPRPGIAELMKVARISPSAFSERDVAFSLAPRINAAGRMDHAAKSVELLLAADYGEAARLAAELDDLNRRRQEEERAHFDMAMDLVTGDASLQDRRTIVLGGRNWNQGVLGIVASRLARMLFRPVVMLCVGDDEARGSGRSIPGLDLHGAFNECGACLSAFGGHAMAAGLTLPPDSIGSFARMFEEAVRRHTTEEHFVPQLWIDYPHPIPLGDIGEPFLQQLSALAPFGEKNREPVFFSTPIRVRPESWRHMGQHHRRMKCTQQGGVAGDIEAVWFNADPGAAPDSIDRLAYRVTWNTYNGNRSIQLVVEGA